jgi:hypothetical protein
MRFSSLFHSGQAGKARAGKAGKPQTFFKKTLDNCRTIRYTIVEDKRKETVTMIKNQYLNEMPFTTHDHKGAPYFIEGAKGFCNHGNLLESMVKFHRGYDHLCNPNTPALDGADIEEEYIEVKSSESGLGRHLGDYGFTKSEQIRYYFANTKRGKRWMYVVYDHKTNMVTEYIMNKREFGAFLHVSLRKDTHKYSNGKSVCVRFKRTTRDQIAWLEAHCA